MARLENVRKPMLILGTEIGLSSLSPCRSHYADRVCELTSNGSQAQPNARHARSGVGPVSSQHSGASHLTSFRLYFNNFQYYFTSFLVTEASSSVLASLLSFHEMALRNLVSLGA